MTDKKRILIPLIIVYTLLSCLLIMTAIRPSIDLDVSDYLTGGSLMPADASYTVANTLEIWIEPVTLIPECFVLAMAAICCLRARKRGKPVILLGIALAGAGAGLSFAVVYRIVKYYCKLKDITQPWIVSEGPFASSQLWVKALCALGGLAIFALFLFIANKFGDDVYDKTKKAIAVCVITLLAELTIISGIKMIWGRMRYRELIQAGEGFTAWFLPQFRVINDGFKSFPSGHTANSMLILPLTMMFDALGKRKTGVILRICHAVWMIVVMTSRIMAGAHYVSDVAAGAFVSLTITVVTCAVIYRKRTKKEPLPEQTT